MKFGNYIKLSAMMFIEYAMFAVWWLQFASYLDSINTSVIMKSLILSTIPLGCMISPLVGMFADRFFSGQNVLSALYLIFGISLFASALTENHLLLFALLLVAMLAYIPTWALSNAVVMAHCDASKFAFIRMFGSIGWASSAVFSVIALALFHIKKFDGTVLPLYCASVLALIGAGIALILPNTLPRAKGYKFSILDAFGLRSLSLMKDKNFCSFIVCSFLAFIPFTLYWSFFSTFLKSRGFTYLTLTTNISQLSQILVMPLLPLMIKKFGIKTVLLSGILAMFVRYLCFYGNSVSDLELFIYAGIVVHGFVYVNFIIGGQIYVNEVAKPEIRSQAQGFVFLVQFGLGMLVGTFVNGQLLKFFSTNVNGVIIYDWSPIWRITFVLCLIVALIFFISFKMSDTGVKKNQIES